MKNKKTDPNTEAFPVSDRQLRKARRFARSVTSDKPAQKNIVNELTHVLAMFGGRISGFETRTAGGVQ